MKPSTRAVMLLLLVALLCSAAPSWSMEMHVEGNQLILSGGITELDYVKFTQQLTPSTSPNDSCKKPTISTISAAPSQNFRESEMTELDVQILGMIFGLLVGFGIRAFAFCLAMRDRRTRVSGVMTSPATPNPT